MHAVVGQVPAAFNSRPVVSIDISTVTSTGDNLLSSAAALHISYGFAVIAALDTCRLFGRRTVPYVSRHWLRQGFEAMNRRSGRGHHIDPVYLLGSPPVARARAYVSRSNRGSSPVASVVAM